MFPLCPLSGEFFNHKLVLNFVKSFFCIYWDDGMVFVLSICFSCLLTDQITKIVLVDTLVHPSNKPVDLFLLFSLVMWHITLINLQILEKILTFLG